MVYAVNNVCCASNIQETVGSHADIEGLQRLIAIMDKEEASRCALVTLCSHGELVQYMMVVFQMTTLLLAHCKKRLTRAVASAIGVFQPAAFVVYVSTVMQQHLVNLAWQSLAKGLRQ